MNAARTELRVGFMPLLDCALLVVAHEVGMARQQGLSLRLLRESSWASIRDRVAVGHFDAAQMLAPMVVAGNVGVGHLDTPLLAPVALGTGGNAITVSLPLWRSMEEAGGRIGADPAMQARALAQVVTRRAAAGMAPLTLAMVFPFSCHNYQLRDWLESGGMEPDRDVRLVVLPPPLLVDALRIGQVDGFCVGEPWGSLAVDAGIGAIAAVGSDVWPRAPEKVLGMRARYAEENPGPVAALVRAIHSASHWAADPGNRQDLAQLLAQPRYVGAPVRLMRAVLDGSICAAAGHEPFVRSEFIRLDPEAIAPDAGAARMLAEKMERWGQVVIGEQARRRAMGSFRADLYASAIGQPAG